MKIRYTILIALLLVSTMGIGQTQKDTIFTYMAKTPVEINGSADEDCWNTAQWYTMDQVWMPYNEIMDDGDFEGKYKVAWDSEYLYVLVEVVDNMLSDDHADPLQNWWDDDCLEVFIDENRSKGNHEKSVNAFAYHMSLFYDAIDLSSSGSGVNYKDNIEVDMDTIAENTYLWEIAIKNYDESFIQSDPEASRVILEHNKIMGFTIGYCDNDETDSRENFIGTMSMTSSTWNENYITADYFGSMKLVDPDYVDQTTTAINRIENNKDIIIYPNPAKDHITIENVGFGSTIQIYSFTGSLLKTIHTNNNEQVVETNDLPQGIYFISVSGSNCNSTKLFVKQ